MAKKALVAAMLVALVGACAPKPEPAPVEPVSTEPVYTGKYK
jgi:hypothetical protein